MKFQRSQAADDAQVGAASTDGEPVQQPLDLEDVLTEPLPKNWTGGFGQADWVDLKQGGLEEARIRLNEIKSYLPDINDIDDLGAVTFLFQVLSAEVALAGGSPEAAVAAAEKIYLRNFPGMGTAELTSYNVPFTIDALARALWKKGELGRAAAEYRRLMTVDPSRRDRYFIHPLYHYRLGRVLEEKGEKAEAPLFSS